MVREPEAPIEKKRIRDNSRIVVRRVGRETGLLEAPPVDVYLFSDVLEELRYGAGRQKSCALLCGQWCVEQAEGKPGSEFIEVRSFREAFPAKTSLDYAAFLRGARGLLQMTDMVAVLGFVRMLPAHVELSESESESLRTYFACRESEDVDLVFEDVMLMRTFFNLPFQVVFIVRQDSDEAQCYRLSPEGMPERIPFYVVSARQEVIKGEG